MLQTRNSSLAGLLCALLLPGALATARDQNTSSEAPKLPLRAALVLTPEFCATKTQKGDFFSGRETFKIGKVACAELEPALSPIFSGLTVVSAASSSADAQVVLLPRFVDVGATRTVWAFSNREMVVLLEWTVKDTSGKTVWIETVEGSAKRHMGNAFTHGKNLKRIVQDSVRDAAEQSASKMSSAPELRKLMQ
jgi:hypothetical protein